MTFSRMSCHHAPRGVGLCSPRMRLVRHLRRLRIIGYQAMFNRLGPGRSTGHPHSCMAGLDTHTRHRELPPVAGAVGEKPYQATLRVSFTVLTAATRAACDLKVRRLRLR
jgi:hypothetical protein